MISVKGTKSTGGAIDPTAPYARRPEERSDAVVKLSLLLVSVVIYLKASLSGSAEAADEPGPKRDPEEERHAPRFKVIEGGQKGDGTESADEEPWGASRAGDVSVTFGFTPGADTIAFARPERTIMSPVFEPAGYVANQANDNMAPGIAVAVAGGSSPSFAAASSGGPRKAAPDGENVAGSASPEDPSSPEDPGNPEDSETPGAGDPDAGSGPHPEDGDDGDEDGSGGEPGREPNRAPRVSGPVILADISGCAVLAIGLADLLRGALDPDGDPLSIEAISVSSGKLRMTGDDLWEFSSQGEIGPVTISYRISDDDMTVEQTLHFAVVPAGPIAGSDGADILIGSMCADEIAAGPGDDLVDALAGDDVIFGGADNDHILAGDGHDIVRGGAGDDVIFGAVGDDRLFGEDGDDRLFGGDGNDMLDGGNGDDLLMGGAGLDDLIGGAGNDRLFGEEGDDTLAGATGNDLLAGGDGADHISGGLGDDHTLGEGGDDILFGDAGDDVIEGGTGDDVIDAGAGDDMASGGDGDDRILGGDGHDRLLGGAGYDVLIGEDGDDVLDGGSGDDLISAGAGDDVIHDGSGADVVHAGAGDDQVYAAADGADDAYHGDEGSDRLDYSAALNDLQIDLAAGDARGVEIGNDTISGFERVVGGAGDDLIRFGGSPVSMAGGNGCNTFEFVAPGTPAALDGIVERIRYEIEDFKVGDRIRMSKWEIFEEAFDELEDRFERLYGDDVDEDRVPIRYLNEWAEAVNETVIEADLDGDNVYETAIFLDGRHALVLFETA